MPIYLAPWSWVTEPDMSYWQMPRADIGLGCLDLRSLPQCGSPGPTPQGYGLFSLREPDSKVGVLVADSLTSGLTLQTRRAVGTALAIGRDALTQVVDNPLALMLQLFNRHADPTGLTRWKPLRGSLRGGLKLAFENRQVYQTAMDATVLANTVAVFQADYRRNKAAGMKPETLRKWTGSEVRKLYGPKSDAEYDELAAQILPPEYSADGQQRPTTVLLDNFNRVDENPLATASGGWSWAANVGAFKVVSNQTLPANAGENIVYANSALSDDDIYAQVAWISTVGPRGGTTVRNSTSADTSYLGWYRVANQWELWKRVTGSFTQLGADVSANGVPTASLKTSATGSTLEIFRDGVSQGTRTDVAITGNNYGGMNAQNANSHTFDDFEVGDPGAGLSIPIAMHHYKQLMGVN